MPKLWTAGLIGVVLASGCSGEKSKGNKSNCVLISNVVNGIKIDEYLIDNGLDGKVDLFLKCERGNYSKSFAYLSQYAFDRVREIQGNSKLAYEIKHPETGETIQFSAETEVIDSNMQIDLDKKYRDYKK